MKKDLYEMEYILGILNSKLIEYLYNQLFMGWQITIPAIESMPIAKIGKDLQHKIGEVVQDIILDKKNDKDSNIAIKEKYLDSLIYSAFGLNDDEIVIIKQTL